MPHNSLKNTYTMIVPTHNRLPHFARLIAYLAVSGAKFQIIVLDSSDADIQEAIDQIIESSPLRIEHERYSPDLDVNAKILKGMEKVKTEYLSLCADDDLVILPTLSALVIFLQENKEFQCAQGLYFAYSEENEKDISLQSVTYATASITDDNPLVRLSEYVRQYQPLLYSVHRTEQWRSVFSKLTDIRGFLFEEAAPACLTVIAGKVARLHLLYYGQNQESGAADPNNPKLLTGHPARWYEHDRRGMLQAFVRYRSVLLDALQQSGCVEVDKRVAKNIVNLVHGGYLAESLRYRCYENADRELEPLTESEIDETLLKPSMQATIGVNEQWRVTFHIGEPLMADLRFRPSMPSPIPAETVRNAIHEMAPYWVGSMERKN